MSPTAAPVQSTATTSVTGFFSPSHNITCGITYQPGGTSNTVFCQTSSPPRSVHMAGNGAFTTCNGGNCLGDAGEGTPTLAYGATSRVGPFLCLSATAGVTCTVSGHGFTIARAGIVAVGGPAPAAAPSVLVGSLGSLVGTWEAHEQSLVIASDGSGRLDYADLTRCPTCSFGDAPRGSVDFQLTSITNGVATGRVTATSDPANYRVGEAVQASTSPAAPGRFLHLVVAGRQTLPYCDKVAVGQCGA